MEKKEQKMRLPKITVDEFFTTQEQRDTDSLEKVVSIPISKIVDFPNHPFKVIVNDEMHTMADSIKQNGVLVPALVRSKEDGGYEMIAGHRRKKASELANVDSMPCIVRELTDDEATIIMVDSNLQREELLPSEKAFAYKMKMEALKHQGKKLDTTLPPMVAKYRSAEEVGKEQGDSHEQVRRYIRLTELIPEVLEMVDDKRMAFRPAVEISYLTPDEQNILLYNMEYLDVTPSLAQAITMKKMSQEGVLTTEKIESMLEQEKPNQTPKYKFNREKLQNVLPKNLLENQVEDFVIRCVEDYCRRQKQKQQER